jgi:TM2 domain-containing membrane protein YozV
MSYPPGPGTSGNVIAAVCSFFFPGLGQLVQGRLLAAIFFFVLACLLWVVLLGWLVHLLAALNAALYRG